MEETLLKAGNIDGEPCLSCDDAGRHMAIKMHNPIQIRGTSRESRWPENRWKKRTQMSI